MDSTFSKSRHRIVSTAVAFLVGGCGGGEPPQQNHGLPEAGNPVTRSAASAGPPRAAGIPQAGSPATRDDALPVGLEVGALRVRSDPDRNRLWVLRLDEVEIYDLAGRTLIRRIALPPWSVARGLCSPDMALDRTGSAFIASNAHPSLFRVDGTSFRLEEREVRLRGREDWSIGFGALGFGADGALLGLVAFGNSLWRIDFADGVAHLAAQYHPPLQRCTLPTYAESARGGARSDFGTGGDTQ